MKRNRTFLVSSTLTLAALALCFGSSVITARGQQTVRAADDAALKAAVATFENGWNNHNATLMTSICADDVEWTAWTGGVLHGRKAVEANHAGSFAGIYRNTHRTDAVQSIQYLGPDLASVDFTWTMTEAKKRDGSDWPYRAGYVNFVMVKRDGRWMVLISHTADFNAKPPASATSAEKAN